MGYFSLFAGVFLGWGLGANDSANVFGIAVYTKVVRYWTAVILTAVFVFLGAFIDGLKGIHHVGEYAFTSGITSINAAFLVMLAAAVTVAVMTILKLPVSTSQAVIGAIIGGGILQGRSDFTAGIKFFSAWILTPVGGMIISFVLYFLVATLLDKHLSNFKYYEMFVKLGYFAAGIFGAYALGANNVANVTGIFTGQLGLITPQQAVIIGGLSIALGALTYSKPVMSTVGEKLVPLSPIAGLVVVLAAAITVYIYAKVGIPVSSSQAVVGAIIGVGFRMGVSTINKGMLRNVMMGWISTPTLAAIISLLLSLLLQI